MQKGNTNKSENLMKLEPSFVKKNFSTLPIFLLSLFHRQIDMIR